MKSSPAEAPLRKLMGPGPLDIHPRVYRALTSPVIGHMDPAYLKTLEQIGERLRTVFQTQNEVTHAAPGTGTSGMEACVANLMEPGDPVLVCVHGYFGDRIRQMAERQEADVTVIAGEWGQPTDPEKVAKALKAKAYKVVTLVHAETSTGVLQPMAEIIRLAKEHDVMILLDAVTSLGGVELKADEWGLDAVYSCSQKCIGAPSGLAPVTFSERAIKAAKSRKHPIRSWYLDITLLDQYWGSSKVYHHTSSSTLNYALLEALRLIEEEGLQNRFERHLRNHRALVAGVEAMGLKMLVKPEHRLPTLNTIRVPDGVDEAKVRGYLLQTLNLEIGAGLGALKGQVWRVGLMGYSSSAENVLFFLSAMSRALAVQGCKTDLSAGLEAAMSLLNA
jgi:alanine-glyoxylate transaminase/serine-glyoxylate transaminase/serine-pyruvate transaminase